MRAFVSILSGFLALDAGRGTLERSLNDDQIREALIGNTVSGVEEGSLIRTPSTRWPDRRRGARRPIHRPMANSQGADLFQL